jgi:hypothetical protein
MPGFTPSILLLHVPFGFVPKPLAEIIYFALSVSLILWVVYLACCWSGLARNWTAILVIAALIVFSRSGHTTLFTGYFTLEIVLGMSLALQFGRSSPWLGGAGLFLAATKPTFAVPLAILMLFRGHLKATIIGTAIAVLASLASIGWLISDDSLTQFLDGLRTSQELHLDDPNEMPVFSWVRIDTLSVIAKWLDWNPSTLAHVAVMLPMLFLAGLFIRQLERIESPSGSTGVCAMLVATTVLVSIYHQFYDGLVLIGPMIGLTAGCSCWAQVPKPIRYLLLFLTIIPIWNYLSSEIILNRFFTTDHSIGDAAPIEWGYRLITSISAISLLLAWSLVLWVSIGICRNAPSTSAR